MLQHFCVNNLWSYFQQCPWQIGVGQGEVGWYTQRVKTAWLCLGLAAKIHRWAISLRAHLVNIAWAACMITNTIGQLRQSCLQFGARGLYAGYGYKLPPKRIAGVLCMLSPDYVFMAWQLGIFTSKNIWSTISTASAYAHTNTVLWCIEILRNTLKMYVYMVVQHCLYLSALQYRDKIKLLPNSGSYSLYQSYALVKIRRYWSSKSWKLLQLNSLNWT